MGGNNPYPFQRNERLQNNGGLALPVWILPSLGISTFHSIAGKESAIHMRLFILDFLCWANIPSSSRPLTPRFMRCLQGTPSHLLVSLTWQCTHGALLTGFPNWKLTTNMFLASNMSLETHSPEPPAWSQTCLLQVSSMSSIQGSLGGCFRKKRRVTGLTLEFLSLNLNFNKFSQWSVYILKFKKLFSRTPSKGISFPNISFASSRVDLFSSNAELFVILHPSKAVLSMFLWFCFQAN